MAISIMDSTVFGAAWTSNQAKIWLAEDARFARFIEIILAYTRSQAKVGVIPATVYQEACRSFQDFHPDLWDLAGRFAASQHSLHGLIETLRERLSEDSRPWFALGLTVQDITDTYQSLVLRDYIELARSTATGLAAEFAILARAHAGAVMLGRTHGQAGVPISLGHKFMVWLLETKRVISGLERLPQQEGQLSGAVGAMTFYDHPTATALIREFCDCLGLACPAIGWTNSRFAVSETLQAGFHLNAVAAKCSHELFLLARSDLSEVRIPGSAGNISSITMAHKRNPEGLEQIETLFAVVKSQLQLFHDGLLHEHERDGARWKAEWFILPAFINCSLKQLEILHECLPRLEADQERMKENIIATRGRAFSEKIYAALAIRLGFAESKRVLSECLHSIGHSGTDDLATAVKAHPTASSSYTESEIDVMFDLQALSESWRARILACLNLAGN